MSIECTPADCQNQKSTTLCTNCVRDLQAWLNKIPVRIAELSVTAAGPTTSCQRTLDGVTAGRSAKTSAEDERARTAPAKARPAGHTKPLAELGGHETSPEVLPVGGSQCKRINVTQRHFTGRGLTNGAPSSFFGNSFPVLALFEGNTFQ